MLNSIYLLNVYFSTTLRLGQIMKQLSLTRKTKMLSVAINSKDCLITSNIGNQHLTVTSRLTNQVIIKCNSDFDVDTVAQQVINILQKEKQDLLVAC